MLKMVDGSGVIGVDMICPLGVSTPQPPNYDRVELEGTGMLVLPNSLDAPLERLELGGKTEQVQTTGKNLFDPNNNYEDLVWIRNDGEIVGGSNARTSDYIPVEQGNYAFQFDIPNPNQMFVAGYNADRAFVKIVGIISKGKCIIKIDDIQIETIRLSYTRESTRIQLERSETQTPYEPYTGGKPSPSPEYPQEIKNSGKWNEETQKYEIEISISGRNLFDFSTCEEGKIFEGSGNIVSVTNGVLTDFIPCFPNSQYSRSRTGSTVVAFYDCDKNKIGFEIVGNTTFVTPEKCRYFRFSALKTQVDYTKIVACPGQTVMDYEPYREPKFSIITSDRPITKWDRLVEQGGQIGWLYGGKIAKDFSVKSKSTDEEVGGKIRRRFKTTLTGKFSKSNNVKCNFASTDITNSDYGIGMVGNGDVYLYFFADTKIETIEQANLLLASLPEKIIEFESESTEFIPLPQSEQNAIRALETYYPTTVITVDGGELDPDIKVTYRKEI